MDTPKENPIKFKMDPERIPKAHIEVMEAEADLVLKGSVGYAFEESFTSLVNSMLAIPLHKKEEILGAVAQLRGLVFAHEFLKEMVVTEKMRQDGKRRDAEFEEKTK